MMAVPRAAPVPSPSTMPLLRVEQLRVEFERIAAVQDVSFELQAGETLGLVGESGSGKSTLARAVLRLIPATAGRVYWEGEDFLALGSRALRARRRELQIVFQDPLASLNPRMSVGGILGEPLQIFEPRLSARACAARVVDMLKRVGLSGEVVDRYPHEFSGGQCQRIGIARAMMLNPKLLICDEPVSSLDVSVQGQIVNLLADLQQEFGTALLFISHNLNVVRHLSHRVMVLYRGRVVETADRDTLFAAPGHPYTQALLDAAGGRLPEAPEPFELPEGGVGPAAEAWSDLAPEAAGCAYRGRCSHARPVCAGQIPALELAAAQHAIACLRWPELAGRSPVR